MGSLGRMVVQKGTKTVAVVVPMYNRKELTPDEEISFRHLVHFLGKYDRYLVIPRSLEIEYPGFYVKRFDDKFFGSAVANTRLMLSSKFYNEFTEYKYILVYQLDALVFSDRLLEWCETDLDYIGAPWLRCPDTPFVTVQRVGNGGFSLRKVHSFLKVIYSTRYWVDPDTYWKNYCTQNPLYMGVLNYPKKYLKRFTVFNGARTQLSKWHLSRDRKNEDYFWSDEATKYFPDFRVASVEMGLRFSFEVAPRLCFRLNDNRMPFGCHAWPRYDRAFWEPYLLK